MIYEYIDRWPSDSKKAAENIVKILAEELGMERVKTHSELADGKFFLVVSPQTVNIFTTLDDRPFVCLLINGVKDDEDTKSGVLGDHVEATVNQVRAAARVPGARERRERQTFGDKVWRENKAKHGIEVSFETKPSDQVLALLKGVGFRYGKSGIWWAKDTPEIRKAVNDMGLTERPAAA